MNMVAAAVVVVSLAALLAAGEACNNVPSMTSYDACLTLSNKTERWHALCRETLSNAPATAELTVYALVAARLARQRYRNSVAEMDQMLGAGKLPGEKARGGRPLQGEVRRGWPPDGRRRGPAVRL